MKDKKYQALEMDVTELTVNDIVSTTGSPEFGGGDDEMPVIPLTFAD